MKDIQTDLIAYVESDIIPRYDTFDKAHDRQHVLTVYIDREEGVNITHCEQVSRALDPQLDAKVFDSLPP